MAAETIYISLEGGLVHKVTQVTGAPTREDRTSYDGSTYRNEFGADDAHIKIGSVDPSTVSDAVAGYFATTTTASIVEPGFSSPTSVVNSNTQTTGGTSTFTRAGVILLDDRTAANEPRFHQKKRTWLIFPRTSGIDAVFPEDEVLGWGPEPPKLAWDL